MSADEGGEEAPLVLDACVVLNLYASKQIVQVLTSQRRRVWVVKEVVNEAIWVGETGPDGSAVDVDIVDLRELLATGLVELIPADEADLVEAMLGFAKELDDGEAASAAVALNRNGVLATDDRKAREVVGSWKPPVRLVSTSQLMRGWAERSRVPQSVVAEALVGIERRATFVPGKSDPEFEWWRKARQVVASDAA